MKLGRVESMKVLSGQGACLMREEEFVFLGPATKVLNCSAESEIFDEAKHREQLSTAINKLCTSYQRAINELQRQIRTTYSIGFFTRGFLTLYLAKRSAQTCQALCRKPITPQGNNSTYTPTNP